MFEHEIRIENAGPDDGIYWSHELQVIGLMCVHRVVARKDSYGPDVHRWLAENIEKTESGFRPWIRSDKEFKFMHERDAVMFALKWS